MNKMPKLATLASAAVMLFPVGSTQATTLLLDFFDNSNDGYTTSSSSDFALADSNVELSASVNAINGDSAPNPATVTGVGISSSFTWNSGAFSQADSGPRGAVPILAGYLVQSNADLNMTIDGIEEFTAGSTVTVTVWAVGDQNDQEATITLTYDGVPIVQGPTEAAGTTSPGDAASYEQFTFTKVDGVDSLDILATNTARFRPVNGIALTGVPEPSVALLGALGFLGLIRRRRA